LANIMTALEFSATKEQLRAQYGDHVLRRIEKLRRGTIPWGNLLQGNLIGDMGKSRATWSPPNFRYYPHAVTPSVRGQWEKELFIAVDISASVDDGLLQLFANNITGAAARAQRTTVVTFDAVIREQIETRDPGSVLRKLQFKMGAHGHTSVLDVFRLVDQINPSGIVVLTDGYLEYPEKAYPRTNWILPAKNFGNPPWGRKYHMEQAW
jgi:predicted metal-dependent peptidase